MNYDAFLLVSFGGPEKTEDVLPFLENVLRGRNVPRERMLQVAEHYYHFDGKSPINDQNRALIGALGKEFKTHGIDLPIYWGNRNWHPMLADTMRQMTADGVKNALAFATSGYGSYSSCRQYRENIASAQASVGAGAPSVDKLRVFHNHPLFVEANVEHVREALNRITRRIRQTSCDWHVSRQSRRLPSDCCPARCGHQQSSRSRHRLASRVSSIPSTLLIL